MFGAAPVLAICAALGSLTTLASAARLVPSTASSGRPGLPARPLGPFQNVTSTASATAPVLKALPALRASRQAKVVKVVKERSSSASTGASSVVTANAVNASGKGGNHAAQGVIYFLFLVTDGLSHANIWQMFFADAPQGSYRALVHCKDAEACQKSGMFATLPMLQQVSTVGTWYCHDLVTAMVQLLKGAVDLQAGSVGVEKFVFVSDSTLPVKPFSEIHNQLCSNGDSDFCVFPADQWGSARIDEKNVLLVKHHQWVVLSRPHVDILLRDWVPVDSRGVWAVPLKGGSWEGRERNLSPQHFYHPPGTNWCTDEWALFATVFGAAEPDGGLRSFGGVSGPSLHMWGPGSSLMQGTCRTWSYWGWDNGMQDFNNLGSRISSDFMGSKLSCYPRCYQRPATLERLSDGSLTALRQSPFLFVRKFKADIWMPNYYGLVLAS